MKRVAEDDSLLNPAIHPKNYNVFKEIMPYAKPLMELKFTKSEFDLMREEMQLMWMNMESPQEACERIENIINTNRQNIPGYARTT